jgi:protein tyrosine phosphatase
MNVGNVLRGRADFEDIERGWTRDRNVYVSCTTGGRTSVFVALRALVELLDASSGLNSHLRGTRI